MKRNDWWGMLCSFWLAQRDRPREFGVWDCWQAAGESVLVMTGIDHRQAFSRYSSLDEGLKILADRGGAVRILNELFGASKHAAYARRGDILLCDLGEGPAACICFGLRAKTVSEKGTVDIRTLDASAAWTVA